MSLNSFLEGFVADLGSWFRSRVWGFWFMVLGLAFRVSDLGFRFGGFGFRVQGLVYWAVMSAA